MKQRKGEPATVAGSPLQKDIDPPPSSRPATVSGSLESKTPNLRKLNRRPSPVQLHPQKPKNPGGEAGFLAESAYAVYCEHFSLPTFPASVPILIEANLRPLGWIQPNGGTDIPISTNS